MVGSLLMVSLIGCGAIFWMLNPPVGKPELPPLEHLEMLALKGLNYTRLYRMMTQDANAASRYMHRQGLEMAQHFQQVEAVLQAHPQLRGYYQEELLGRRKQLTAELDLWFTQGMASAEPGTRVPSEGWIASLKLCEPVLLNYGTSTAGALLLGAALVFSARKYNLVNLEELFSNEAVARSFLEKAALVEARQYQLQQMLFSTQPDSRWAYLTGYKKELAQLQRVLDLLYPPLPKGAFALWKESLDPATLNLLLNSTVFGFMAMVYLWWIHRGSTPKRLRRQVDGSAQPQDPKNPSLSPLK